MSEAELTRRIIEKILNDPGAMEKARRLIRQNAAEVAGNKQRQGIG